MNATPPTDDDLRLLRELRARPGVVDGYEVFRLVDWLRLQWTPGDVIASLRRLEAAGRIRHATGGVVAVH